MIESLKQTLINVKDMLMSFGSFNVKDGSQTGSGLKPDWKTCP